MYRRIKHVTMRMINKKTFFLEIPLRTIEQKKIEFRPIISCFLHGHVNQTWLNLFSLFYYLEGQSKVFYLLFFTYFISSFFCETMFCSSISHEWFLIVLVQLKLDIFKSRTELFIVRKKKEVISNSHRMRGVTW
jgi:hypothetical protein